MSPPVQELPTTYKLPLHVIASRGTSVTDAVYPLRVQSLVGTIAPNTEDKGLPRRYAPRNDKEGSQSTFLNRAKHTTVIHS